MHDNGQSYLLAGNVSVDKVVLLIAMIATVFLLTTTFRFPTATPPLGCAARSCLHEVQCCMSICNV